ncbi:MAG: hypothetical protein NUV54_00380, partial [Candidatus Taylorbacteria bacterium]|nr:hypothetical protein [Candidatus Taylorbacteria bacterium]
MEKDKQSKPSFTRTATSPFARPAGAQSTSRTFHSDSLRAKPPQKGMRLPPTTAQAPKATPAHSFGSKTVRGFGGKKMDRPRHRGPLQGGRGGASALGVKKPNEVIPPLAPDAIRIIPLGGVEQIGKNMTMVEFGNDIIVIDAGFQFKDEDTPGIDYILPN